MKVVVAFVRDIDIFAQSITSVTIGVGTVVLERALHRAGNSTSQGTVDVGETRGHLARRRGALRGVGTLVDVFRHATEHASVARLAAAGDTVFAAVAKGATVVAALVGTVREWRWGFGRLLGRLRSWGTGWLFSRRDWNVERRSRSTRWLLSRSASRGLRGWGLGWRVGWRQSWRTTTDVRSRSARSIVDARSATISVARVQNLASGGLVDAI